jgi:hypothetical protein
MLDNLNSIIRNGLLDLIKANIGDNKSELKITGIRTNNSKRPIKGELPKGGNSTTALLTLQSLTNLELDLTHDQTIIHSEANIQDDCYRSYKYLKDLSQRVRTQYINGVRKARSSLLLPKMKNELNKDMLFPRGEKKRNSGQMKGSDCNLPLVRLYPCESDCFKISLVKCEKY